MELEHEGAPISVTLIKPSAIDTPYTDHAKNYLPVEPLNPPPVYAPETVAEAILYGAENAERDVYVGGGGKSLTVLGNYAPRTTDKVMEWTMFDLQKSDEPARPRDRHSLDKPSGPSAERGHYPGHVAESSLYTKSSPHPVITGGLLLAGAGLGYALYRGFRTNGNSLPRNPELSL